MPSFLTREFGFTTGNGLAITSLSIVVMLVAMPSLARLSDRIGRKPVMIAAAATSAIAAIPGYALASTGDFGLAVLGAALMALCFAGHSALIAVCLVELFPTRVRGTAYSLGYNIATAIFGGAAPLVMTSLIAATGQTAIPAYYVVLTAVGSGIAALFMKDGARKPIQ